MSSRRYPGFKPTVQRSPPLQIPQSDDGASSSAPMLGSVDIGELHAPYRPSLPGETEYQTPPSHHDMTEPGSMHRHARFHDGHLYYSFPEPGGIAV
jgi:hypothetical protein